MKDQDIHKHVPDWKLERYILGELPPGEVELIRREAEHNASLRGRLDALYQSNQDLHNLYPPAWMSRQIQERLEAPFRASKEKTGRLPSWLWPVPALAVLLLVVVLPTVWVQKDQRTDSTERLKGLDPHLLLFRKTDAGGERLKDGHQAREKELVQVMYQAAGQKYGAILSVDGRGSITLHLPHQGVRAARLGEGRVSLDFAYQLDDAPLFERFYFITSDMPFEIDPVVRAIQQVSAPDLAEKENSLELPDSFGQFVFTLKKGRIDE